MARGPRSERVTVNFTKEELQSFAIGGNLARAILIYTT